MTAGHALRTRTFPTDDRIALTILTGQIETARDGIKHDVPIPMTAAPYLQSSLASLRDDERRRSSSFSQSLHSNGLTPATPRGSVAALAADRHTALAAAFALDDASSAGMDDVIERRIAALVQREVSIDVVVFIAICSAAALMVITTRSMSGNSSA